MSKSHMILIITTKFGLHYPDIDVLTNPEFHHLNPSLTLYNGKLLKIWRIDNRRMMMNRKMFFWGPGQKYHTDHQSGAFHTLKIMLHYNIIWNPRKF